MVVFEEQKEVCWWLYSDIALANEEERLIEVVVVVVVVVVQ